VVDDSSIEIVQYVIYDHPSDYPQHFVLRCWYITDSGPRPDSNVILGRSVEDLQELIPPDYTRLNRFEDDDPAILEVWI
jgi:hypothetical protein